MYTFPSGFGVLPSLPCLRETGGEHTAAVVVVILLVVHRFVVAAVSVAVAVAVAVPSPVTTRRERTEDGRGD